MIETLISSKTRIKLLLKFFLNPNSSGYLRGLEQEFGESTNSIRLELNRFEKAGLLSTHHSGNKKLFQANTSHPLFNDVNSLIFKYVGLDKIIAHVVEKLGSLERLYLVGSFAKGLDSSIIDLLLVGKIDRSYLMELIDKAESLVNRKIRFIDYDDISKVDWTQYLDEPLLLWEE